MKIPGPGSTPDDDADAVSGGGAVAQASDAVSDVAADGGPDAAAAPTPESLLARRPE